MNRLHPARSFAEKMAALARVAPFDRLRPHELAVLAEAVQIRLFAPAAEVHPGGAEPPRKLIVIVGGTVRDDTGSVVGPVHGLASLFDGRPVSRLLADGKAGAEVLTINRHTFFTLAHECPELVRGFLELGPAGALAS
jgi:signal-transduction protein with cAMP-binding, CBS, and nucleotidyltransferase domain